MTPDASRPSDTKQSDLPDATDLATRLELVNQQIDAACARVGRDPVEVTLLPISKSVPVDRLVAALKAGLTTFGENRVQEAEAKAPALPAARWELVGHLQSNKVGRAVRLFDVIHSVDSVELGGRLDRAARELGRTPYPIYLEVNVDRDPAKFGLLPEAVDEALAAIEGLDGLELRGLMTVGREADTAEEARPTFRSLRELSEALRRSHQSLGAGLSMGMSHDFEVAVEEGATVVRLGRVLFGPRQTG